MKSDIKVVLLCLAIIILLLMLFFAIDSVEPARNSDSQTRLNSLTCNSSSRNYYFDHKKPSQKLTVFDPNTADSTTLLGLGLPEFTVRAIYKYRAKGGVFSSADDFARMHGITQGLYRSIKPYIRISDDFLPASDKLPPRTYASHYNSPVDASQYPKKLLPGERISINTADTNALKRVPGLGSYFAKRIVELRQRYGGFISLDQLLDIKGFPEASLEYLTIPDGDITRININTASFRQLQIHPYIGYSRAKTITDYRRLKGNITSLLQLSLMPGFSDKERERLEPYIEF